MPVGYATPTTASLVPSWDGTKYVATTTYLVPSGYNVLTVRIAGPYSGCNQTIKYNGTALTQQLFNSDGNTAASAFYDLDNPTTGSSLTLEVSSGSYYETAIIVMAVQADTTTPRGAGATAGSFTGKSVTVTTVAGDGVVGLAQTESATMTGPASGTSDALNVSCATALLSGGHVDAIGTGTTMSWTGNDFGGAIAQVYKAPAAGGATPTLGLAPSRFAPGKRGPGRGPVLNAMRNLAYSPASTSVAIAGTTLSGARLLGAALTQTQVVAGTARGTARLNGALSQTQPIAGTARSSSRLTGTLAQTQAVAGIVRALARLTGTLGQSQAITGTTRSGARLTGAALTQSQPITGTARSGARLTGASLLQSLPLAGTVRSIARLIGNLNVTAPGAVAIAGTTRALSRLLGVTVTQTIPLTGQARSLSRTQGVLTQTIPIAGTARSTSRLTGLLNQSVAITGVVRAGARAPGATVLQSVALRGVVRGMARLFGALDAFVAGTVRAKSPTSATVTVAATSATVTSNATATTVTTSPTSVTIT